MTAPLLQFVSKDESVEVTDKYILVAGKALIKIRIEHQLSVLLEIFPFKSFEADRGFAPAEFFVPGHFEIALGLKGDGVLA